MDWIKIKTQHVLFSGLTPSEKGILVMVQALTAHIERMPTEKEIISLPGVSRKSIERLSESLRSIDVTLSEILRKVIEDVSEVHQKRESNKLRQRNLRSKNENVTRDKGDTSQVCPIREDKIREDNKEKQQAAKRKIPSFTESAAAAFFDIDNPEDDILKIIDRVIEIRIDNGQKKGIPVDDKSALKAALIRAYEKSPDIEMELWKSQILEFQEAQLKIEQKRLEEEDISKLEYEENRRVLDDKSDLTDCMNEFSKLTKALREEIWDQAEKEEKKDIPEGIKPFRHLVQKRVAKIMKERGL